MAMATLKPAKRYTFGGDENAWWETTSINRQWLLQEKWVGRLRTRLVLESWCRGIKHLNTCSKPGSLLNHPGYLLDYTSFVSRQRRSIKEMQEKRKTKNVRKYGKVPKYSKKEERELIK
jgi:hypothetical protein